MTQDFDPTNTGMIYRNYRREEGSRQPDMTGSVNVEGVEYWISGWTKDTKEGGKLDQAGVTRFVSLAVKRKDEQQGGERRAPARERAPARNERRAQAPARGGNGFDDMEDDIPF